MWTARYWADRFWAPRYWNKGGALPPPPPPPPAVDEAIAGWLRRDRLRRRLKTLRAKRDALRRQEREAPPNAAAAATAVAWNDAARADRRDRPLPDVSAHDAAIATIEARIAGTLREIADEDRRHRKRMRRRTLEDEEILLLFF